MEVADLTALIRKSQELLVQTRNVGETGQWDDLYTVVDFMSYAFGQAYPTLPCKAGCSHCCEEMLFRVTEVEWAAVARYLEEVLTDEARADLKLRASEALEPQREALERLAEFWNTTEMGTPGAPVEGLTMRCPFLSAEGHCGVYEVRPLVCRSYGNFGVTIGTKMTMLICQSHGPDFIGGLLQAGAASIIMPPIDPFVQRLKELAPESSYAPLPLWLLRWASGA